VGIGKAKGEREGRGDTNLPRHPSKNCENPRKYQLNYYKERKWGGEKEAKGGKSKKFT
jgi:hypothetical protein